LSEIINTGDSIMQKRNRTMFTVLSDAEHVPLNLYMHLSRHMPNAEPDFLHHHNQPELGICLAGRGIFYIHGNVYPFEAGDISIIYPGENHIAQSVSAGLSDWWFLTIDEKAIFADWSDRDTLFRLAAGGSGHILTHGENRQIASALYRMVELYTDDSEIMRNRRSQMGALFASILYETAGWDTEFPKSEEELHSFSGMNSIVYPAIQYMLNRYMDPIDTEMLCVLCHISPVHLRRIFTATTGVTPIAFLHRIRISHACLSLTGTEDSILSISEQCGYTSLSSFNRQFQKQMHMSPSEYRRAGTVY